MEKSKLESNMEEAAKKAVINLMAVLSNSLTIKGKQARMKAIAESLIFSTSEDEE